MQEMCNNDQSDNDFEYPIHGNNKYCVLGAFSLFFRRNILRVFCLSAGPLRGKVLYRLCDTFSLMCCLFVVVFLSITISYG